MNVLTCLRERRQKAITQIKTRPNEHRKAQLLSTLIIMFTLKCVGVEQIDRASNITYTLSICFQLPFTSVTDKTVRLNAYLIITSTLSVHLIPFILSLGTIVIADSHLLVYVDLRRD